MMNVGRLQAEIYNHYHASSACQSFFLDPARESTYAAYYTSMYLLQDTADSLLQHRKKGFSEDPLVAYIEFWGVMQALIIQQDAIGELFEAVVGRKFETRSLAAWWRVRDLRNLCAGHPARRDRKWPLARTFMARGFGSYQELSYALWEGGHSDSPRVKLGDLIDEYEQEAKLQLEEVLHAMQERWPKGDA